MYDQLVAGVASSGNLLCPMFNSIPSSVGTLFAVSWLASCSLDWDALDPRETAAGGAADGTTSSTSASSSGGTGGATGRGGGRPGSGGGGSAPTDPRLECERFCKIYVGCLEDEGFGGGPAAGCSKECVMAVSRCGADRRASFLGCIVSFEQCSDLPAFESCVTELACS